MAERALEQLDMQPRHLALLRELLRQHLPHTEIWAYGSRVNGDGHEASDLDLVVRHPADLKQETPALWEMKDILVESNLPIRVDLVDWAQIPASFHREIERAYVVVQQ
ncbi:NTP_transf_2 domain-containing protein [Gammaproteobacteria bacterium]